MDSELSSSDQIGSIRSRRPRIAKRVVNYDDTLNTDIFDCLEETNVEDVYRQGSDKISNFNPTSLETIYELPKGKSQNLRDCMGAVKLKRQCRFSPFYNPSKCKLRMRKTKSRKLKRIGVKVPTGISISLEQVKSALQDISEDENEENYQPIIKGQSNDSCLTLKEKSLKSGEGNLASETGSLSTNLVEMQDFDEVGTKAVNDVEKSPKVFKTDFEGDLNINFSGKLKIDRRKKLRRQSGRLQPLCLSNALFNESSPLKGEENINVQTNVSSLNEISHAMTQGNVKTNFSNLLLKTTSPEASTSLKFLKVPIAKDNLTTSKMKCNDSFAGKKTRRNSGVNRPLYRKDISSSPNEESPQEISSDVENPVLDNKSSFTFHSPPSDKKFLTDFHNPALDNKLLSPSSMLELLNIDSSETTNRVKDKRTRRKSARLSCGKGQSLLGSVWMENKRNLSDEVISESFPTKETSPTVDGTIDTQSNIPNVDPEALKSDAENLDSPILSGIFDCKARLTKQNRFIVKKGLHINLNHFKVDS